MAHQLGPASPSEIEQIVSLLATCLPGAPAEYHSTRMRADPQVMPQGKLVARDASKVIANVKVYALTVMFGDCPVPCGGIGGVATHPDYRRRGLASSLMDEAHRLMRNSGCVLSLLATGIHEFYKAIGYWTWERPHVNLLQLKSPTGTAPTSPVRKLERPRDLPALKKIHESYSRKFTGWVRRSDTVWEKQVLWTPYYPKEDLELALVAGKARPQAYVRAGAPAGGRLATVLEFGMLPGAEPVVGDLAAAFVARLLERGFHAVCLPAPCRELLAALAPHAAVTAPMTNASMMVRLLDFRALLGALIPTLSERAATAKLKDDNVELRCADQAVVLRVNSGVVTMTAASKAPGRPYISLDSAQWLEVVMGVRPLSAQPFAKHSWLGETQINLLDALFPRCDSVFWEADTF